MVLAFLLISLPSVVVTILLGALVLDVDITLNPLALLVIPLCAAPLAGVGAMAGLVGRSRGESGNLTFPLTFLLMALGPVVIPPDRLPDIALALGRLSPATYAASALRQSLVGPVTSQIILDAAVLAAMAVLFLWLCGSQDELAPGMK
jgi:ABC-2 type transport system permease protein